LKQLVLEKQEIEELMKITKGKLYPTITLLIFFIKNHTLKKK